MRLAFSVCATANGIGSEAFTAKRSAVVAIVTRYIFRFRGNNAPDKLSVLKEVSNERHR